MSASRQSSGNCSRLFSPPQIGFGTIWEVRDLITGKEAPCSYSLASAASAEYQSISGCSGEEAPIAQFGCSHWDETCFRNELMTPSIGIVSDDNTVDFQFSRVTVAALNDLGYSVDYSAADPYTAADMDSSCTCFGKESIGDAPKLPEAPMMSNMLREKATSYGKKILRAKHRQRQRLLQSKRHLKGSKNSEDYVGDRAVFLLLRENGIRYSLVVTESYD